MTTSTPIRNKDYRDMAKPSASLLHRVNSHIHLLRRRCPRSLPSSDLVPMATHSQHADPAVANIAADSNGAAAGDSPKFVKTFGNFGVTSQLAGRGKFAKVYVAYDMRTMRKVAARVANVEDEDATEEAKVLKKLHKQFEKPYVVECLQKFDNGRHFVMFMEFCEGGSLEEVLKVAGNSKGLPLHICRRLFMQMAKALECMNELKIVHRDLKPANVMLTSKNLDDAEVRLIDFGFAKRANMMHSVKGSPAYMAPERLMKEGYGFRAEIYAIGIILFEMIYGFQPFAAADTVMALYRAQAGFELPKERVLPVEAQDMLMRCLQTDQHHRPSISDILSHPFVKDTGLGGTLLPAPMSVASPDVPSTSTNTLPGGADSLPPAAAAPSPTHTEDSALFLAKTPPPAVPLRKPPLPPSRMTGASGASFSSELPMPPTPIVRVSAPPLVGASMPAMAPVFSPMSAQSTSQGHLLSQDRFPAQVGSMLHAEDPVGAALLEGAATVVGVASDPTMNANERIILAAYAIELAQRACQLLVDTNVNYGGNNSFDSMARLGATSAPPPTTKTTSVSHNAGFEGGLHGSFATNGSMVNMGTRMPSTSFALSAMSSINLIKTRCKSIVRDALPDVKSADATCAPAQVLLLNYVRRALLNAARQEYMRDPHCAFGPVVDVYSRCDVLLAALEKDASLKESHSVSRLRAKLADRIVSAHSTTGAFAGFTQGELYSAQPSSAVLLTA
jgi:serine/threonine protein kinase